MLALIVCLEIYNLSMLNYVDQIGCRYFSEQFLR